MLKFLLGLILTVVGIPIITILLLLDFSPDIPVEYYEASSIEAIMEDELNNALDGIEDGKLAISLSEENINKLIYNVLIMEEDGQEGVNPLYKPTGVGGDDYVCDNSDCEFIQYEPMEINGEQGGFGVTGMWVEFYEDVISLNVSVKGSYLVDFQTRMRLEFEVADNDDSYTVTYSKIRVGNIPLPKGVIKPIVNLIIEQANVDTSSMNNEFLTVELDELRASVDKTALVEELSDDPRAQAGLNLVFDNKLVTIDVFDESEDKEPRLEVYVDVDKLSVDSMPMVSENDSFDLEGEITRQMNNIVLSVFTGDPQIVIDETTINHLIATTMGDMSAAQLIPMGDFDLDIEIEGVWFELAEGEMELNFQLRVNETHLLLELHTMASNRNGDLVFTIDGAYLGRDAGEAASDYITITAEDIGHLAEGFMFSNELFSLNMDTGEMVISNDSISDMIGVSSQGITIDGMMIQDDSLVIDISLPQQEIIQQVVEEVTEVLDTLEEDIPFLDASVPEEAAFEEKVQEIAASIDVETGDVDIAPEDLEELTELYNDLPPEAQEDFVDYIEENVDPSVFEDFLNSF